MVRARVQKRTRKPARTVRKRAPVRRSRPENDRYGVIPAIAAGVAAAAPIVLPVIEKGVKAATPYIKQGAIRSSRWTMKHIVEPALQSAADTANRYVQRKLQSAAAKYTKPKSKSSVIIEDVTDSESGSGYSSSSSASSDMVPYRKKR